VIRGMKRSKPKPVPNVGFSFGYGENESPIRKGGVTTTTTTDPLKGPSAALDELRAIWREIQSNRVLISNRHHHEDFNEASSSGEENTDDDDEEDEKGSGSRHSFIEDLGRVDPNSKDGKNIFYFTRSL
jgi:hypothetical protein